MTSREKLLWAAFEHAKAAPETYDQGIFGTCGTVGCLAFHVCKAANLTVTLSEGVSTTAAKALALKQPWTLLQFGEYGDLFGCADIWNDQYKTDRIAWLENHIRSWLVKYGNAGLGDKV